jgi:hypothetical protein
MTPNTDGAHNVFVSVNQPAFVACAQTYFKAAAVPAQFRWTPFLTQSSNEVMRVLQPHRLGDIETGWSVQKRNRGAHRKMKTAAESKRSSHRKSAPLSRLRSMPKGLDTRRANASNLSTLRSTSTKSSANTAWKLGLFWCNRAILLPHFSSTNFSTRCSTISNHSSSA